MKPKDPETLGRYWGCKEYLDDISLYMAWQKYSWNVNMLKFHQHSIALYQMYGFWSCYARINSTGNQTLPQETQESEGNSGRSSHALQRSIEVCFGSFSGGTPTSICHFFCPSICASVWPVCTIS